MDIYINVFVKGFENFRWVIVLVIVFFDLMKFLRCFVVLVYFDFRCIGKFCILF